MAEFESTTAGWGMRSAATRALANVDARQCARVGVRVAAFALLAVLGRVAFAAIPSVQPVTALCVLCGVLYGRRSGCAVGVLAAIVSNVFLGQGIWTVWQAVGWGLSGWLAGVLASCGILRERPKAGVRAAALWTAALCAFGFAVSLLFGFIMNSWIVLTFGGAMPFEGIIGIYVAGLPFDMAHAASTVAFLVPACAARCALVNARAK